MNYFNAYPLCVDENVTTAWKSQVAHAAKTPSLAELLAQRGGELFPSFTATYTELRSLPRGARRALQRRLAHSRELSAVLQEWFQHQSGRALQQKLACTLAGTALLLVLGQGVSDAATIIVNTTKPGIAADGMCSLIEAIINANNNALTHSDCLVAGEPDPIEDHIILPSLAKITLTAPFSNPGSYGSTGLPLITSAITIEGNGSTIIRKKSGRAFRLIAVTVTGDLELESLTLSGGAAGAPYGGGAILNLGTITITNSTISKNKVTGYIANYNLYGGYGGGITNGPAGTLSISNSTISGNNAIVGGAVANEGNFSIDNGTQISKNTATAGAAIANAGGSAPTQTITNSTISGNIATLKKIKGTSFTYFVGGLGGGVLNENSTLTIFNSTISGNSAKGKKFRGYLLGGQGGGIWNGNSVAANLTLTGGSVTGNAATFFGGGLFNVHGVFSSSAAVAGNTAKYGPDIYNVP